MEAQRVALISQVMAGKPATGFGEGLNWAIAAHADIQLAVHDGVSKRERAEGKKREDFTFFEAKNGKSEKRGRGTK